MEKGFFLRYDEFNSNPEANLVAGLCGYDVGYGCNRQKFIFRILVEMNRIPTNLQLNRVEGMGMARCAALSFKFSNNRDSDFLLEHRLVRSNKFQAHLEFLYPDSREGEKVDDFLALELSRRKEFLEKIVIEKTAALAQSGPEGRLRCVDRNGRPEYYWRKDGKDVTGAYIPVGKREFAAALAQRNYDQAVLNYAKEELRLIKQLAKKRAAHNIENVYEEYGFARRALVNPVWVPDDEFVAKWQQTKYKKRVFKEGEPEFFTKRGERVMSKTEILIANILADLGVPYLYEFPLYLTARGWIKTDFATLNVRTRRIRFWEHFGKMGDPDYCADRLEKILDYERDGYFPGTHLIITHETQDRPADTRLLEAVARHYLL